MSLDILGVQIANGSKNPDDGQKEVGRKGLIDIWNWLGNLNFAVLCPVTAVPEKIKADF